jgi:site-specific recombinase XerC
MAGNIQRRPDGKWRARHRDTNHREHARHFARKRDAERWLASQEVAISRGEWVDPTLSKITVGEWLPQWLARQVQLIRPRFFDPAAEKAGLPGVTPHELRHTAASLAVAAGANVKAVQQMLGHASAAMTLDGYAGLFADDLDAVADQLDRAFTKLNADQMRTARRPSQSSQGVLPFESSPEQSAG